MRFVSTPQSDNLHYSQTSNPIKMKNPKYTKWLEIQDTSSMSSATDGSPGARHPSVTESAAADGSGRVEVHPLFGSTQVSRNDH
jgi:hypothetical protein